MINPYSIGPSISGLLSITLGLYVLSKDYKNKLNQSFFLSNLSIGLWLSFYGVLYNTIFGDSNYYRIAYCGIALIPITIFTFISTWVDLKWTNLWDKINYLVAIFECYLILNTDYIISGTYNYYFGIYPKAGPYHYIFLIYFIGLLSFQIIQLFYSFIKNKEPLKRNQTKLLFVGYFIISLACIDFIPNYGIPIYPPGFICALAFALILGYAIFKHNLLEIKTFISNGIVYSMLIAFLYLFYSVLVLILERTVQNYFGYKSLSISIIFAFIIGALVVPLKNLIQNYIDNSLLKGTPIQISEENTLLRQELTNADKLRSIAILASSLAHEIKNPVTTINTFAQYLPAKQNDKEFLDKCQNTLFTETKRIERLLNQLLSFAKPSPPVFAAINPVETLEEILLLLEHKCLKKKISIKRMFQTNETILADANQLKQAFLNILLNALDAMPNGGQLSIETRCEDNQYFIVITDTGLGIKPEDLKKIFAPFFTSKENGVGLGLAITHEIITHHNGKIEVKSTPNVGTEFKILFSRNMKGETNES